MVRGMNGMRCLTTAEPVGFLRQVIYMMTMPVEIDSPPRFEDTRAGFSGADFQDKRYIASDVRKSA